MAALAPDSSASTVVGGVSVGAGGSDEAIPVVYGQDGEQYVTVVQDGQTYAIPYEEYRQMLEQEGSVTVQATPLEMLAEGGAMVTPVIQAEAPPEPVVKAESEPVEPPGAPPANPSNFHPVYLQGGQTSGTSFLNRSDLEVQNLKPIRVDNWGIFLLNRLQTCFQNKEFCDLALRFPNQNAQIKVHKLVMNACCNYFTKNEAEGNIIDGVLDMPTSFTPEAVAPVIRFMYTGKLDIKYGMFSKLKETAAELGLEVLSKLMDAQLNAPQKTGPKKRKGPENDPLKQIKRIKQIEKRFSNAEKRAKIQAKRAAAQQDEAEMKANTVPGKKLPIWKRRSTNPHDAEMPEESPTKSPTPNAKEPLKLTPVSGPPPGAKLVRLKGPPPTNLTPISSLPHKSKLTRVSGPPPSSIQPAQPPSQTPAQKMNASKAYSRSGNNLSSKPKIPRQIREIQENLNFEKIRKTGVRNPVTPAVYEAPPKKDMSVDELKEFMAEQRKRYSELGEDDTEINDDEYFDNDAGLDYEDQEVEEEEEAEQLEGKSMVTPEVATPKPILKSAEKVDDSTPRKSVRFSLRATPASNRDVPQASPEKTPAQNPQALSTPSYFVPHQHPLDATLDEFNKAVEAENESKPTPPSELPVARKSIATGPRVMRKNPPNPPKASVTQEFSRQSGVIDMLPVASASERDASTMVAPWSDVHPPGSSEDSTSNVLPYPNSALEQSGHSEEALRPSLDIAELTAELLKNYPHLLHTNPSVSLKVHSDNVVQYLTLKSSQEGGETVVTASVSDHCDEEPLIVDKESSVVYMGVRGRPKKVQLPKADPCSPQRKGLNEKVRPLKSGTFRREVMLDKVSTAHVKVFTIEPVKEIETPPTTTLAVVTEAVTASMTNGVAVIVPSSDLEQLQNQTILVNCTELGADPKGEQVSTAEEEMSSKASDKEETSNPTKKNVSDLALDWEDE
ncbi:hypothetical protein TCAL_03448 [Tigriopus californicus]|uniref:BTB domain-containing protein n=2 Tax=Tigriopus californicus TaxID=6832 RepID=A0A553NQA0_TIGCA|nr:hypothetical protein TCAL_03448 [Tigriopus californicus]|eukprot:TCALIF_03448-PA protein Name:"Similar to Cp190 Centrosome-associated zinc finger protein CP190 (Drosophila melanogaster)" AED:0.00 eAED:0.00 QI:45/1/1/1/1/1/2/108/953